MKQSKLLIQIIAGSSEGDSSEFREYAQYVGTLFSYQLPLLNVGKTKKILIEFLEQNDILYVVPEKLNASIYTVRKSIDFTKFKSADDHLKKRSLSESTRDGLLFLFDQLGWDYSSIETTYDKIIESDFQSRFVLTEAKGNKSGTVKAAVVVEHFLKDAVVSMVFLNKNDIVLKKIDLFVTAPSHIFYGHLIGSTKWSTDSVFQLKNKTKEYSINASIDGSTHVNYTPKHRDIESVKEEIKYFTTRQLITL
jgi:hypothetical protein